jgi:hypothetical protein
MIYDLERERRFFKMIMISTDHNHQSNLRSPFAFKSQNILCCIQSGLAFLPVAGAKLVGLKRIKYTKNFFNVAAYVEVV